MPAWSLHGALALQMAVPAEWSATSSLMRNAIGIMYSFHVHTKKNTNPARCWSAEVAAPPRAQGCQRRRRRVRDLRMARGVPYTRQRWVP